jgi:hypothetical protein
VLVLAETLNAALPEGTHCEDLSMRLIRIALLISILTTAVAASATIFGSVRGVVHDPQHRPIQGAMVMLKSKSSDWAKSANTDANGEFAFNAVPLGDYSMGVANPGFAQALQPDLLKRYRM